MPLCCWHILNEEKNVLEIFLLLQILFPATKESCAHVQVELIESVRLREVGVPQSDGGIQWKLPQQQVIHPSDIQFVI